MEIEQKPASTEQPKPEENQQPNSMNLANPPPKKALTKPKPFKFHTSTRTNKNDQSLQQIMCDEENNSVYKSKPMPKYASFIVKKSTAKLTIPKTFNFATQKRGEEKLSQSMMVESFENEEVQSKQFKALPMPNYNKMANQFINKKIEVKKPTIPKEIKFRTDSRSDIKKKTVKESNSDQKEYQFKAKPMPKNHNNNNNKNKVFQVKKKIQKIKISNEKARIPLNSEQRLAQRKLFADRINEKKMEEQQSKQEQEKNKLDSLRKELKFKATPIKKYKVVKVQKSAQKPTVPIEKKFQTDARAQKMKFNSNNESKENRNPQQMEN